MASESSTPSSSSSLSSAKIVSDHHHTYESTRARESLSLQADPIHWVEQWAVRRSAYRQLHHQRGIIGEFSLRLCEGINLQRSHWSPLALGPVKHLGLSKAHGPVSAFCQFHLHFSHQEKEETPVPSFRKSENTDRKPSPTTTTASSIHPQQNQQQNQHPHRPPSHVSDIVESPVVAHNDNPMWENCTLSLPLRKGHCPDGQRIHLTVRVHEDATAVETVLPGSPARLLGMGTVDLTTLCLGQTPTSLLDLWIPIHLPGNKNNTTNNSNEETGRIHVLVSYKPHGLEPHKDDIVALEAFARRPSNDTSCRPILSPPLQPLQVVDRKGSYLLVRTLRRECVRLHRHAVFVVERTNLVDAAQNLVLLPADFVRSTPLGQQVTTAAGPVLHASQELLMPALLSLRLLWMALRTTTIASISGVQALSATLVQEGIQALVPAQHTTQQQQQQAQSQQQERDGQGLSNSSRPRGTGNVKFVQL